MPAEIDRRILALAVRIVGRRTRDSRAGLDSSLAVRVRVLHPDEHGVALRPVRATVGRDHGSVPHDELYPVRSDAKAHEEPEGAAQPLTRRNRVLVCEHGDHRRSRNGAVLDQPPFPFRTSCSTHVLPSGSAKSANEA